MAMDSWLYCAFFDQPKTKKLKKDFGCEGKRLKMGLRSKHLAKHQELRLSADYCPECDGSGFIVRRVLNARGVWMDLAFECVCRSGYEKGWTLERIVDSGYVIESSGPHAKQFEAVCGICKIVSPTFLMSHPHIHCSGPCEYTNRPVKVKGYMDDVLLKGGTLTISYGTRLTCIKILLGSNVRPCVYSVSSPIANENLKARRADGYTD